MVVELRVDEDGFEVEETQGEERRVEEGSSFASREERIYKEIHS